MRNFETVDEYIKTLPDKQGEAAASIRNLILQEIPDIEENIAYGMPAYKLNGKRLLYYAAFKNHIGFYPLPSTMESFKIELAHYKQGKGSVQFPLSEQMPLDLIRNIILVRMSDLKKGKQ